MIVLPFVVFSLIYFFEIRIVDYLFHLTIHILYFRCRFGVPFRNVDVMCQLNVLHICT